MKNWEYWIRFKGYEYYFSLFSNTFITRLEISFGKINLGITRLK